MEQSPRRRAHTQWGKSGPRRVGVAHYAFANDSILIPIQCEYYALEGLIQLMQTARTVKRLYNSSIAVEGVLLTMYDSRLNLTNQVVGEIKKYFADRVFRSTVPRSVRISEAPSYGEPICYYS